jgi:broad specificity phosphatase PhoE
LPENCAELDTAWTSPALRARQTAAALQLEAMVDPALKDVDLGRWVGRSFADVQETEPEEIAAWTSRSDAAPHGVNPWLLCLSGSQVGSMPSNDRTEGS